jgi:hypothetical protein
MSFEYALDWLFAYGSIPQFIVKRVARNRLDAVYEFRIPESNQFS